MFIVFEWVDGSWKDTQLNKTVEYLRQKNKNIQIWITKEPTANTLAWKEVLKRLKNGWFDSPKQALELYVKDREEQSKIRKEILNHSTILSSRFDYSTYAYQWASWIDFETIFSSHNYKNILIPDLTFIFDVSSKNMEKRLKKRATEKEFFEDLDFLLKVKDKYLETYNKFKDSRNIVLINANWSIDEVFLQVKNVLDKYF